MWLGSGLFLPRISHVTRFPSRPQLGRHWFYIFAEYPAGLGVPHSSTVSPMGYNATTDHTDKLLAWRSVSGSPSLIFDRRYRLWALRTRETAEFMMQFPEHDTLMSLVIDAEAEAYVRDLTRRQVTTLPREGP